MAKDDDMKVRPEVEEALKQFQIARDAQADYTIQKLLKDLSVSVSVASSKMGDCNVVRVQLYYKDECIAESDDYLP